MPTPRINPFAHSDAVIEQVSNSTQRITPPSGRSYNACFGEKVKVCRTCNGEGHHDSCFDCGNRGYFILEEGADVD